MRRFVVHFQSATPYKDAERRSRSYKPRWLVCDRLFGFRIIREATSREHASEIAARLERWHRSRVAEEVAA